MLDEAADLALAGGGALIVLDVVTRETHDLDYFATDPSEVEHLLPALSQALTERGLDITIEQSAPGFARLIVSDANDQTRVDLAADARLLPTAHTEFGDVLSIRELAVDKVLALFGRAEARDFIDLAALEPLFPLHNLFQLAAQKDLGFDVDVFRQMANRIDRLPRDEFDIDDETYRQVLARTEAWKSQRT